MFHLRRMSREVRVLSIYLGYHLLISVEQVHQKRKRQFSLNNRSILECVAR